MTNEDLQAWVEDISLKYFGKTFDHRVYFNQRLRSTGGRYLLHSHHIEVNPKHLDMYGLMELEGIIKHELCHYHLHLSGKGYRHKDKDFKELLQQVGGSRYCKPIGKKQREPYRYIVICKDCKAEYKRKRKMNVDQYVCGKCKGKLVQRSIHPQNGS
ncbi:SprT family protein [Microaerobacter geothermalis]|uniref:SprT family protein n=1 Tax=Microaerobacter geothermalis TaxID=674972 RepID=UPI001F24B9DC|nr:SprT family protein [Microaerobacter geothermalis]MCF6093745.1 SprT family protein [Microaerobacter geothermalis]